MSNPIINNRIGSGVIFLYHNDVYEGSLDSREACLEACYRIAESLKPSIENPAPDPHEYYFLYGIPVPGEFGCVLENVKRVDIDETGRVSFWPPADGSDDSGDDVARLWDDPQQLAYRLWRYQYQNTED